MAGQRAVTTVRLPVELAERAKSMKAEGESFNDLVIDAVEREVRRRQGWQALDAIRLIRKRLETETGLQPDSVPLIRELRERPRG